MARKRATVLIADDEESFRSDFADRHSGPEFAVEQMTDVYALPEKLRHAKKLPDLVVLDLYRTRSLGTPNASADNAEVDKWLTAIDEDTTELKAVVDRVKEPAAIDILRQIREIPRLSKLPVLIYTRQGLSILSDDELKEATQLGASWMLKGRPAAIEEAQMHAFLRQAQLKRKRLERDIVLTVVGALLGLAIDTIVGVIRG